MSEVWQRGRVTPGGTYAGGLQRMLPTGGCAYGMPKNSRPSAVSLPRTAPLAVSTSESSADLWGSASSGGGG